MTQQCLMQEDTLFLQDSNHLGHRIPQNALPHQPFRQCLILCPICEFTGKLSIVIHGTPHLLCLSARRASKSDTKGLVVFLSVSRGRMDETRSGGGGDVLGDDDFWWRQRGFREQVLVFGTDEVVACPSYHEMIFA